MYSINIWLYAIVVTLFTLVELGVVNFMLAFKKIKINTSIVKFNNILFFLNTIVLFLVFFVNTVKPSFCNTRSCGSLGLYGLFVLHAVWLVLFFLNYLLEKNKTTHFILISLHVFVLIFALYYFIKVPRWTPDTIVWKGTIYENYSLPKINIFVSNFIISSVTIFFGLKSLKNTL